MKKAVQVVGYKGSGKSSLIKKLSATLQKKGYEVTVIKSAHEELSLNIKDSEMAKVCDKYIIVSPSQTLTFIPKELKFLQVVSLAEGDFLILEGFKSINFIPRIVCLNKIEEKKELECGCEIAFWEKKNTEDQKKIENLVELVESKGCLLGGLDCGECGNPDCKGLLQEILKGDKTLDDCLPLQRKTTITINGNNLPLSPFVATILVETFGGFVGSLKGATKGEVVIKFEYK